MPNTTRTIYTRFACWGLVPAHVLKLRPGWTEMQALDWLIEHQQAVANAMARVGWQVLGEVLDETGEDDDQ